MGRPDGFDTMEDKIFVIPLLTSAGQVTVNSGGTVYEMDAPAGASAFSVPFKIGAQSFALNRDGSEVISATSLQGITEECPCGLYNFNAYVGTVPESEPDVLGADGLTAFTNGLKVACDAQPSLPATPPEAAAPTETSSASVVEPTTV